jgi:hypothetical protein
MAFLSRLEDEHGTPIRPADVPDSSSELAGGRRDPAAAAVASGGGVRDDHPDRAPVLVVEEAEPGPGERVA